MDCYTFEVGGKQVEIFRSVYAPVKSNMFTLVSGNEAAVFDPNEDYDLLALLKEKAVKKVRILLTHGHFDHISGVPWLKDHFAAEVLCQERCADRLANSKRPLSRLVEMVLSVQDMEDGGHRYQDFKRSYKPFTIVADRTFGLEVDIQVGALSFHATATPGHSEGSTCYTLLEKLVFTGDTLLQEYPVILKFPGGSKEDYERFARPYLQALDPDSIILPGHGEPFVLKDRKIADYV